MYNTIDCGFFLGSAVLLRGYVVWLANTKKCCRHTYIRAIFISQEHAGEPLFALFRAIKSQLEKGPVDAITGEARNSLSEEKLLRQHLDVNVVEGVVENENEVIPIKLLDTDTISQAKEKILDALYKNTPVSRRPQLGEVDLELRRDTGKVDLELRRDTGAALLCDYDSSNTRSGEWVKVNTLGHYKLGCRVSGCLPVLRLIH